MSIRARSEDSVRAGGPSCVMPTFVGSRPEAGLVWKRWRVQAMGVRLLKPKRFVTTSVSFQ